MRLPNWELNLIDAVNAEALKPYDWATANCGHLMGAAVTACLGPGHPVTECLDQLHSEEEFVQFLRDQDGLANYLGQFLDEVPRLRAQTGDLGVVAGNGVEAGCVIVDGVAMGKSPTGVYRVPVRMLMKAFRV